MDLYGENQFRNSKVNDKKIIKIIIILMVILLFLAIGIVCTIYYLKNKDKYENMNKIEHKQD